MASDPQTPYYGEDKHVQPKAAIHDYGWVLWASGSPQGCVHLMAEVEEATAHHFIILETVNTTAST